MTLAVLSRGTAVGNITRALRLPPDTAIISPMLLGQALRRTSFMLAPCSRSALERTVIEAFRHLIDNREDLEAQTTEALDALLAYGDLLEMRPSEADGWSVDREIIRPAAPSFIMRPNGAAILLGVAGDDLVPFGDAINARLRWHGVLRHLDPLAGDDLRRYLMDLGLLEIRDNVWLRMPPRQSAEWIVHEWQRRVAETSVVGDIDGLEVLDGRRPSHYYRGRWTTDLRGLTGLHIARRRQRFGSPAWCAVALCDGRPERLLDFSGGSYRERACDMAWQLQMALDAVARHRQEVRVDQREAVTTLAFGSPLPSWAERRLAVHGERTAAPHCLLSYSMPTAELTGTLDFLSEHLWLGVAKQAASNGDAS